MVRDYDLVCIGSGPAGQRAAVQASKLGRRVAVVECRQTVGGACLETGTIPSKTFREAVLQLGPRRTGQTDQRNATRPTADALLDRVRRVLAREAEVMEHQLRRNDVEVLWGHAKFVDPHTLEIENTEGKQQVTSEFVLIAVGTKPTDPPGAAVDGETVITSDGVVTLRRLPKTIAVVGAGIIGIEYASMFAALGIEVTLVDKRTRPLEFLDDEIVDELIHQMRNANVVFRGGEAVERMEVSDGPVRRVALHLESGKRIVSQMVLFSVGRTGDTARLDLAAAGLSADERGRLKVDDHFRTAVPHIFAAGDVIGYPSLAATSSRQGRLAALYAFGADAVEDTCLYPIGIYSIPEVSMVGATERELTAARVPYEVGVARYREIARGHIVGDDSGLFKMLFHRETRKLLGVHIIGTGATELLHIGQAVMTLDGGLDYFIHAVFNYPTLAECYKVAALDASNKLAF